MASFAHPSQKGGSGLVVASQQRGSGEVVRATDISPIRRDLPDEPQTRSAPYGSYSKDSSINSNAIMYQNARRKGGKKEGGGGQRCTAVCHRAQHFSFIYPHSAEWLLTSCLLLSLCTHWYTLPLPFGTQSFAIDSVSRDL